MAQGQGRAGRSVLEECVTRLRIRLWCGTLCVSTQPSPAWCPLMSSLALLQPGARRVRGREGAGGDSAGAAASVWRLEWQRRGGKRRRRGPNGVCMTLPADQSIAATI